MATSTRLVQKMPVVVILGCTGVGKSKLAIDIARKFGGEVISADSMQIYKQLDIVTNKVTVQEQALVKHHLIDYVSPLRTDFTVQDFKNDAVPVIGGLLDQRSMPIIVGGTNYYIESLLWNFLIEKQAVKTEVVSTEGVTSSGQWSEQTTGHQGHAGGDGDLTAQSGQPTGSVPSSNPLEQLSTKELHEQLQQVDIQSSRRIHPNSRRKIIRALEVYEKHGVSMTELLEEQHGEQGSQAVSGPLRYHNPCMIWIQCKQEVLDERLDKRVDQMISNGLLEELGAFHQEYNQHRLKEGKQADYTRGIFQTIGFKEFHDYLILPEKDKEADLGKALLKAGIAEMKLVTKRYARRQTKWIVNRFLKRHGKNIPSVYPVDSTDVEQWDEKVWNPAVDLLSAFIEGKTPTLEPLPTERNLNTKEFNRCELCDRVFVDTNTWNAHLGGRRHKKMVERHFREAKRKHIVEKLEKDSLSIPAEATSQNDGEDGQAKKRQKNDS